MVNLEDDLNATLLEVKNLKDRANNNKCIENISNKHSLSDIDLAKFLLLSFLLGFTLRR